MEVPVQGCDTRGILTLQSIMNRISMRRLKTMVLDLPEKIETVINLELKAPWDKIYKNNHELFSIQFGKNRVTGNGWNSAEFFGDLVDLRQLCNHPALVMNNPGPMYHWNESSKIVNLVQDPKVFLGSVKNPRAVIFSEFKRFLEMYVSLFFLVYFFNNMRK